MCMPASNLRRPFPSTSISLRSIQGFTLIELVIGMVVMAIALTIVTSIMMPTALRSIDPIYQVKATELANGLMNEIMGKRFDEQSDASGGSIRCDESLNGDSDLLDDGERACSLSSQFGPMVDAGEVDRNDFDDVDDFHGYTGILNSLNRDLAQTYPNFTATVSVVYTSGFSQTPLADPNDTSNSKLITINVTTPNGLSLVFSRIRGNY